MQNKKAQTEVWAFLNLERETSLELATSTLAGCALPTELFPRNTAWFSPMPRQMSCCCHLPLSSRAAHST